MPHCHSGTAAKGAAPISQAPRAAPCPRAGKPARRAEFAWERFVLLVAAMMRFRAALGLALPMGLAALLSAASGCGTVDYFPGTQIPRTEENRKIVETIEQYRRRLLERNIDAILVLASDKYFEDSGTPRSDDDYGYDGLRGVLTEQLKRIKSMRYEIEYRTIKVTNNRAEVEVFLDGSFELSANAGDRYRRVNDYHRFVLEQRDEKWKFLSGM